MYSTTYKQTIDQKDKNQHGSYEGYLCINCFNRLITFYNKEKCITNNITKILDSLPTRPTINEEPCNSPRSVSTVLASTPSRSRKRPCTISISRPRKRLRPDIKVMIASQI